MQNHRMGVGERIASQLADHICRCCSKGVGIPFHGGRDRDMMEGGGPAWCEAAHRVQRAIEVESGKPNDGMQDRRAAGVRFHEVACQMDSVAPCATMPGMVQYHREAASSLASIAANRLRRRSRASASTRPPVWEWRAI